MRRLLIFVPLHLVIALACWGVLMANIQRIGDRAYADSYYRHDLAGTLLLSLTPGFNVALAVFGTGFAEQGWRLSRRPY